MAFRELPFKIVLMQEFSFYSNFALARVCLGEVRAEVAIFATYIANYAKYSKLDSVFKLKMSNLISCIVMKDRYQCTYWKFSV